jgi:prolipoprotein diacylglyceryltransferase
MYPHALRLSGAEVSIWNLAFLAGALIGYPVLVLAHRYRDGGPLPRWLPLHWLVAVYVSALGAQLFAYVFDLNTSALPPRSVSWTRYYLDPLYGPKTLYGAILFLPLTVLMLSRAVGDLGYGVALDSWTPPMFVTLAICRIGCFLEGCCYGVPSSRFGVRFPVDSSVYHRQLADGAITAGSPPLPVVPTQALEALALLALGGLALARLRAGRTGIFVPFVAVYSVLRFAIEAVRDDATRNFLGPLSTSQWIALLVVGSSLAWMRRPTVATAR